METWRFSITLKGSWDSWDESSDELEDKLFDAGCNDALISYQGGRCSLEFDREAESLEIALATAVSDVCSAGYSVATAEAEQPIQKLTELPPVMSYGLYRGKKLVGFASIFKDVFPSTVAWHCTGEHMTLEESESRRKLREYYRNADPRYLKG